MLGRLLGGAAIALATSAWIAAPAAAAPDRPAAVGKLDRGRLDALVKAADAIDGGADPKGLLAARQAALAEGERLFAADSPDIGQMRIELARAWFYNGEMKAALALTEVGLPLLEHGGTAWADKYREARGDLAVMYNYLGRHAEARTLFQRDYEYFRTRYGPSATAQPLHEYAVSLNNLAASDYEAGENEAALTHNGEALAMAERLKPVPVDAAIWYANRINYLFSLGRFDEAVDAARTGQARIEAILPPGHPYVANNLSNFAALLLKQGRYSETMDMSRRAFELQEKSAGKVTQNSASMRIVFARAMIGKGDYAGAEAFLAGALPTLEESLGADSDRAQSATEARAQALVRLGRTQEALKLEQQVVEAREKRLPAGHRDRMFGRETLGDIALVGGDLARAEREFAMALDMRRKVQPPGHADLLAVRARLLAVRARIAPTPALAAEADSLLAALTASARYELDRASVDTVRLSFANLADALIRLDRPDAAFAAMQWASRTSADDAVAAAVARSALAGKPELAALLRERQDLLLRRKSLFDSVQAQMQKPDPAWDVARVAAAAAELNTRLAAADARLDAAGLASADRFRIAPLAEVKARLGPGDALWMATQLPLGYAVMAVTRSGAGMAVVDPRAEIGTLVGAVRATLDPGAAGGSFASADAHRLYAMLAPPPVARALAGKTRLVVAANGPLSSLPFALLVTRDGRSPAYLIDRAAVSHVPGPASLLRQGGAERPASAGFIAFGSPGAGVPGTGTRGGSTLRSAGDARTIAELPGLPGSAAELAGLARAVGASDPRIFTGAAATEAALRAQPLPDGAIIAFATHGLVSGELEGLREPALVLTPSGEDDGLLTASEIARLSLPASWAILSACDTAAGAGPDAPGLTGLAQAFLFAGTRHLLATHWPVRDDVATRLTVGTLQRASAGTAPAEALRQAVLALRRDRSLKGATSPSVWGPFVLIE